MDRSLSRPGLSLCLPTLLRRRPQAVARLAGGEDYPGLTGIVRFYQTAAGVVVWAEVTGLPAASSPCGGRIFGFHIHAGDSCAGTSAEPFSAALGHYDPGACPHPYHAGDLPPLFGSGGAALSLFLTDRFSVSEVIGKTVILHDHLDDLTTQPSGGSGKRIACGVIRKNAP